MANNTPDDPAELDQDFSVKVETDDHGKRLDAVLAARVDTLSRNRIQALIKSGEVTINGRKIVEPKHRVNDGDELVMTLPVLVMTNM